MYNKAKELVAAGYIPLKINYIRHRRGNTAIAIFTNIIGSRGAFGIADLIDYKYIHEHTHKHSNKNYSYEQTIIIIGSKHNAEG